MLNGRNYINNDYTSVSSKVCTVVVSQEHLQFFTDFSILHVIDVMQYIGIQNTIARKTPYIEIHLLR